MDETTRRAAAYLAQRLSRLAPNRVPGGVERLVMPWMADEATRRLEQKHPKAAAFLADLQTILDQRTVAFQQVAETGPAYQVAGSLDDSLGEMLHDILEDEQRFLVFERRPGLYTLHRKAFDPLVGASKVWRSMMRRVQTAAGSEVTVLLNGEPGSGKDRIAEAIHRAGPRRKGPLVVLPGNMYTREVVVTALQRRPRSLITASDSVSLEGMLATMADAADGTLYLDHVDQLPLELQAAVLRFLESPEETFKAARVTGKRPRVIASSTLNLQKLVAGGRFRKDLFLRLALYSIDVPPLRRRIEDIPLLVETLLPQLAHQHGLRCPEMHPNALEALNDHIWMENIRELEAVLLQAMMAAGDGMIHDSHLSYNQGNVIPLGVGVDHSMVTKLAAEMKANGVHTGTTPVWKVAFFLLNHRHGRFVNKDFFPELDVAPSTGRRILQVLTDQGFINKHGSKKGSAYSTSLPEDCF